MLLVVDANIVFSALVAGKLTNLILSPKLELIGPELLFTEIKKHKEEVKTKSKLTELEFEILLSLLERKIRIVPMDEFISLLPKAEELLGEHKKDAPYVALALKLKCSFWSYEKRFSKVSKVVSLTTEEIRSMI
ncbi:MAG: nucleotide-binding protein [Nanoarchaeota archaeon]|nr:nucleotide-binding protein [Nanoarchaeota archaeon]